MTQKKEKSRQEVLRTLQSALEQRDAPMVSLNDVVSESEYSRQTVHERLTELEKSDAPVSMEQIGGGSKYWIEEDGDTRGRPKETEDCDLVQLLENRDKVALATGEIADMLEIHRKTAFRRMENLEEKGVVEHDELQHGYAWYLSQDDPYVRGCGAEEQNEQVDTIPEESRTNNSLIEQLKPW